MTDDDLHIYRPIGEGGKLSGYDERLLDMARSRMSGEEMYESLGSPDGLTPARCVQRVREIVKSQDYLTVSEQKSLILLDFIKLRDMLFDRVEGMETRITKRGEVIEVESVPGWANALIRLLKEWRVTIDSMQQDVDNEQGILRKAHAEIMMQAISVMFDRFIQELNAHGVKVSKQLATDIFEDVMPLGFQALESKTAA